MRVTGMLILLLILTWQTPSFAACAYCSELQSWIGLTQANPADPDNLSTADTDARIVEQGSILLRQALADYESAKGAKDKGEHLLNIVKILVTIAPYDPGHTVVEENIEKIRKNLKVIEGELDRQKKSKLITNDQWESAVVAIGVNLQDRR